MTSTPEHTRLPWSFESAVNDAYILFDEAEKRTIGLVGEIEHSNSGDIPRKQYLANAAYIVRAANAFPLLVAALQQGVTEALGQESISPALDDWQVNTRVDLLEELGEALAQWND